MHNLPLRTVSSIHQCPAKRAQKNDSKRHFFQKTAARCWQNRVLSSLRRRRQSYSSVVISVSAASTMASLLLQTAARHIHLEIPSPSVRLLGSANADWLFPLLRRTQLRCDWMRLGWCVQRLLVIFSKWFRNRNSCICFVISAQIKR